MNIKKAYIITLFSLLFSFSAIGQSLTDGWWWSPEKDAKFNFYKAKNGYYYGKLVWLEDEGAKDTNNPDKEKRSRPLKGVLIFNKFDKKSETLYEDGKIYDAKSGKMYSGTIRLVDENTLELRGYVGISLLGRTETMKRVE